jgi:transcriptional regulator with GAF, ATPase, and Fis domain
MSEIIWVRPGERNEIADYIAAAEFEFSVVTFAASVRRDSLKGAHVVVIEPPLGDDALRGLTSELRAQPATIPVVIYDPLAILDERSAALPGLDCTHITEELDADEFAAFLKFNVERFERLNSEAKANEPWRGMLVGESQPMKLLHSMIRLVGPRKSTVLITGETGTGKEIVARAIHMASDRAGARMVAVNCAAIPENLFESELFGHARGAFTGAVVDRLGRFEQAHRGTIFLDEIGEVPLEIQPKLLRVLQQREIQRLGGTGDVPIDVRVVAASNQELDQAVADGRFREDLLYRLNVVPIVVPPLRDRVSDIPLLADHFIEKICLREGFRAKTLSPDAQRRLADYEWPGNVRQLEHTIEMAVTLSAERERLYAGDIHLPRPRRNAMPAVSAVKMPAKAEGISLEKMMNRVEQMLISEALQQCGGNKAKAANSLGIPRTTLVYKLRSLEACA